MGDAVSIGSFPAPYVSVLDAQDTLIILDPTSGELSRTPRGIDGGWVATSTDGPLTGFGTLEIMQGDPDTILLFREHDTARIELSVPPGHRGRDRGPIKDAQLAPGCLIVGAETRPGPQSSPQDSDDYHLACIR
ncbi:MAG: hypothetical protein Q4D79_07515 [Propionibacteriaceae bacterium]|nr:hypothetical protein [Propionibacteriaceae bacterium]